MPSRVLNALRLGLGAPPSTMVDSVGSDGLTPLALAAICGESDDRAGIRSAYSIQTVWAGGTTRGVSVVREATSTNA